MDGIYPLPTTLSLCFCDCLFLLLKVAGNHSAVNFAFKRYKVFNIRDTVIVELRH